MRRIMIAAMSSGSGKTTIVCALLKALRNRGINAEGFKCGPDYIDPMFHREVIDVPCRNLDLFLQGEEGVLRTLKDQTGEVAVIEGAMGYYDGVNGTTEGSAWQIAALSKTPVILVVSPSGIGTTLAAQINGIKNFRNPSMIVGVVLNNCSKKLYQYLEIIIERECGLPVLGYLPKMGDCALQSRHLGLVTPKEIYNFKYKMNALAVALEENCEVDTLLGMGAKIPDAKSKKEKVEKRCTIAVARDHAFCFYYEENWKALENAGAKLVFFSPLNDQEVPDCDGLYLGGGYPELYTKQLSENVTMLQSVKSKIEKGLPVIAECGGFLYLQHTLDGLPMADVLGGDGFKTDHLQQFGYLTLKAEEDSLLFRMGEEIPAHEFHYWDCTDKGRSLTALKANGKKWKCGICSDTMYAGFPHLHFGGKLPLAQHFVEKAVEYKEKKHDA